jgi:hypothetical protein
MPTTEHPWVPKFKALVRQDSNLGCPKQLFRSSPKLKSSKVQFSSAETRNNVTWPFEKFKCGV